MSRKLFQRRLSALLAYKRGRATHLIAVLTVCAFFIYTIPLAQAALIVNTESFESIDAGDTATNVELRFGASSESIYWDILKARFDVTDDLHVENNLTSSGGLAVEQNIRAKGNSLSLNSSNNASDTALSFGDATLAQTLSFVHSEQKFRFSTSLEVTGNISGSTLNVSGTAGNTFVLDGNSVVYDATNNRFGINKAAPTTTLEVRGTISGSSLRVSNLVTSGSVLYSSGSKIMPTAKGLSGQLLVSQATAAPKWATPVGGMIWYFDGVQSVAASKGPQITMPFGVTLSGVTLKAKGSPTGAALIIDVSKDGTSIFATRPQINAGQTGGGSGAIFATPNIPTNAVLTLDIDQVGSTFAGSGLTIMLTGTRKY